MSGSGSGLLDRWELGITTAVELQYFDLRNHTDDRKSSAIAAGITIGRREPLGHIDLRWGARFSVAALLHDDDDRGAAEARGGLYLGTVLPRTSRARFRTDLVAEVRTDQGDTPITPGWAVSAMFGVEIGGP